MPDAEGVGGGTKHREIREDRAYNGIYRPDPITETFLYLQASLCFVGQQLRFWWFGHVVGAKSNDTVAVAGRDQRTASGWAELKSPANPVLMAERWLQEV
jgi:hypothetical protein